MAQLLIIRHGETIWNRERRFQGVIDIPLSERGQEEAKLLAIALQDKPLAAIYSSPLSRALATAEQIASYHRLVIQVVDDLREINVGEWGGMGWEEIWEKWPDLGRRWHANPQKSPAPPGGEYYPDFQNRSLMAMEKIAAKHDPSDQIVLVCHGGVIRAVMNQLFGLTWETRGKFFVRNCSITRLDWRPGGPVVLASFNESNHLQIG